MFDKNAAKSGLWTALWSFLGLFSLTLLDVLQEVAKWASTSGATPLPGLSVLGYGLVAAATAAVSGFIAFVVRTLQGKGILPGTTPVYENGLEKEYDHP